MRRGRGRPASFAALPAGSALAGAPFRPLRRPPSTRIELYRTIIDIPIGNDGIAFPQTFTGAGTARAFAGPSGVGTNWEPAQASIYTSVGAFDPASATLFVGPLPTAQYQVAAFLAGGGAQIPLAGVVLVPGWFIWVLWTGGTPGATAFLNVTGLKHALVIG